MDTGRIVFIVVLVRRLFVLVVVLVLDRFRNPFAIGITNYDYRFRRRGRETIFNPQYSSMYKTQPPLKIFTTKARNLETTRSILSLLRAFVIAFSFLVFRLTSLDVFRIAPGLPAALLPCPW